jgi:phage terminase large subunit-like protein
MLWQHFEKDGLTCVDIPQTYVSLTDPINETERLKLRNKFTDDEGEFEEPR